MTLSFHESNIPALGSQHEFTRALKFSKFSSGNSDIMSAVIPLRPGAVPFFTELQKFAHSSFVMCCVQFSNISLVIPSTFWRCSRTILNFRGMLCFFRSMLAPFSEISMRRALPSAVFFSIVCPVYHFFRPFPIHFSRTSTSDFATSFGVPMISSSPSLFSLISLE